jgi:hypothetical protein
MRLLLGAALCGAPRAATAMCAGSAYAYCRLQQLPCDFAAFPITGCPPLPAPWQSLGCKCEGGAGRACARAAPRASCYQGRFPLCVSGGWVCN